jgi:hypothetical protein
MEALSAIVVSSRILPVARPKRRKDHRIHEATFPLVMDAVRIGAGRFEVLS